MDPNALTYISEGNIPSLAANSVQVMKMAQALARAVPSFELLTMRSVRPPFSGGRREIWEQYGITRPFRLVRLPAAASVGRQFEPGYRSRAYMVAASLYAACRSERTVYTRSPAAARRVLRFRGGVMLETHEPPTPGSWVGSLRSEVEAGRLLGIVTISPKVSSAFERCGVPQDRILVAPDAVDLERFGRSISSEHARRTLGVPPRAPMVAHVGHLYDGRGIDTVFACAQRLSEVQFVLVGGLPHDVAVWRRRASEWGLRNVRLPGFVPNAEVPVWLAAADVLVMPYSARLRTAEWMSPMKAFEYMAAQRPIVATDLPGIRGLLHDDRNAVLVEPDSPSGMEAAISSLLEDPQRQTRLARAAFADVQSRTWDARASAVTSFLHARLA